jgi:hypothetical protein
VPDALAAVDIGRKDRNRSWGRRKNTDPDMDKQDMGTRNTDKDNNRKRKANTRDNPSLLSQDQNRSCCRRRIRGRTRPLDTH